MTYFTGFAKTIPFATLQSTTLQGTAHGSSSNSNSKITSTLASLDHLSPPASQHAPAPMTPPAPEVATKLQADVKAASSQPKSDYGSDFDVDVEGDVDNGYTLAGIESDIHTENAIHIRNENEVNNVDTSGIDVVVKIEEGRDIEGDIESEYGSFDDEEEALIGDVLSSINHESEARERRVVYPDFKLERSLEDAEPTAWPEVEIHRRGEHQHAQMEIDVNAAMRTRTRISLAQSTEPSTSLNTSTNLNQTSPSISKPSPKDNPTLPASAATAPAPKTDTYPPLARFRTSPKKPLSVTDLVSPSWCEIQYFTTLAKFGRKPRTAAMKAGTRVHRKMEEEVHAIVPVQTKSQEDRFALRVWNVVSGLRTLRATGMTRELEVWGVLGGTDGGEGGEVVNGIIDEISFAAPEGLEDAQRAKRRKEEGMVDTGQPSITSSFANANSNSNADNATTTTPFATSNREVYISDLKTRTTNSIPGASGLRPTVMQLMLYRRLLLALATNTVDADTIFARYRVRPLERFTPTFVSEIERLNGHVASDDDPKGQEQSEIRQHRTLRALWSLMISEFGLTFSLVSPALRAEFRLAATGALIGSEMFTYEDAVIGSYVRGTMQVWKGEREARGVEIEDAFKCRICVFAADCAWRIERVEDAVRASRMARESREEGSL